MAHPVFLQRPHKPLRGEGERPGKETKCPDEKQVIYRSNDQVETQNPVLEEGKGELRHWLGMKRGWG